jgi:hypothetical protein
MKGRGLKIGGAIAALLGIVVLGAPTAVDAGEDVSDDGNLAASQVPQEPEFLSAEEAEDAWTLERMRAAQPLELIRVEGGEVVPAPASEPEPFAKRIRATKYKDKPFRMFGKVFFSIGTADFVCSATSVKSATFDLALTAGHCVFDDIDNVFVDDFLFVPAFNGNKPTLRKAAPFGVYPGEDLFIRNAWANSDFSVDFAFAELGNRVNPLGAPDRGPVPFAALQQEVGAHHFGFNQPPDQLYKPHGYPSRNPFDGNLLYSCKSGLRGRDNSSVGEGPAPLRVKCNMTQGSSGGGWLTNVQSNKVGTILSNVSYGKPGDAGFFHGPYYGNAASSLYNFAVDCSEDNIC